MERKRKRWEKLKRYLGSKRLVFIDETWIKTNMAPLRGWNKKGERLRGYTPYGHWKTMTFIGALRSDGIQAPCVFDGAINGVSFKAYMEQMVKPILKPKDIVIMDNLGSHKNKRIREIVESAGAKLLYLPPYSPDLNPIEQAFSQIKHWMRDAQKRRVEELWRYLGKLIQTITPLQCKNYIVHAGYVPILS